MPADPDPIVAQITATRDEFERLVQLVSGPRAVRQTASSVERDLWRGLLALGARLLSLFFAVRTREPVAAPVGATGAPLPRHATRPRRYLSVFGPVLVRRPYFWREGEAGRCPHDEALGLPAGQTSELLQDWLSHELTSQAYEPTLETFGRILGFRLPKRSLQQAIPADAADVAAFYDQKAPPPTEWEGPILVATADGKGVPMKTPPEDERATRMKEAVLVGHYTVAPHVRSVQAVLAALLYDSDKPGPATRPRPVAKEVFATLAGKDEAFAWLGVRLAARDGPHIRARVALTDGAAPLQERMLSLSGFTLVLDIVHVKDYLWLAAESLFGAASPHGPPFVRTQLEHILAGRLEEAIAAIERAARTARRRGRRTEDARTAVAYFRRNAPYMRYQAYLQAGWPIATGVAEGACGYLVKHRMQAPGMRWLPPGAQPVLQLRAVRANGDWDAYRRFHHRLEMARLYPASSDASHPEAQLLGLAA
jgi:hypothetical protein